jgi:hypothetical protein
VPLLIVLGEWPGLALTLGKPGGLGRFLFG